MALPLKKNVEQLLEQDATLATIVQRLAENFKPEAIYLFGSRARGDHRTESDYDFLVVLPTMQKRQYDYILESYEVLSGIGPSIDVKFTSLEKFEARKDIINTVQEAANTEGHKLYAA